MKLKSFIANKVAIKSVLAIASLGLLGFLYQNCSEFGLVSDFNSSNSVSSSSGNYSILVEPDNIVFQDVAPGLLSAPINLTIRNVGDALVKITDVKSSNPSEFEVTRISCPNDLRLGGECAVQVTFRPPQGASGSRTGILEVKANNGKKAVVSMSGVANSAASITMSATDINFGSINIDSDPSASNNITNSEKELVLRNSGTAAIPITNVAIAGTNAADFSIVSNSCPSTGSLGSNATCTIRIKFDPSAPNERMAQVNFMANGQKTVVLRGTGVSSSLSCNSSMSGEPSILASSSGFLYAFNLSATAVAGNQSCKMGAYFLAAKVPTGEAKGWYLFRPTSSVNPSIGNWELITSDIASLAGVQDQRIAARLSNHLIVKIQNQYTFLSLRNTDMSVLPLAEIYGGFGVGNTPMSAWLEMFDRNRIFKIATAPAAEGFSAEAYDNNADLLKYTLDLRIRIDSEDVSRTGQPNGHFFALAAITNKSNPSAPAVLKWFVKDTATGLARAVDVEYNSAGNIINPKSFENYTALTNRGFNGIAPLSLLKDFNIKEILDVYDVKLFAGYGVGAQVADAYNEMVTNTKYMVNVAGDVKGRWLMVRALSSNTTGNIYDFNFAISNLSGPVQKKNFNLSAKFATADEGRWGAVYVAVSVGTKLYFYRNDKTVIEFDSTKATDPAHVKSLIFNQSLVRLNSANFQNFAVLRDVDFRAFSGSKVFVAYGVEQSSTKTSAMPADSAIPGVLDEMLKFTATGYKGGRHKDVLTVENVDLTVPFSASGMASGNLNSYSLSARVSIAGADFFKKGYLYACANFNTIWVCADGSVSPVAFRKIVLSSSGDWFVENTNNPVPYLRDCNSGTRVLADCDTNLAISPTLPLVYDLATNADFSTIAGTKIFMAYGIGTNQGDAFKELFTAQPSARSIQIDTISNK